MAVIDGAVTPAGDALTPTRSVARDQLAVLGMAEGLLESAVLIGLLRLGVFDALASDAMTAHELARALGVQAPTLRRALDAAVSLDVLGAEVHPDGVHYRVREPFASVLDRSSDGYLGDWLLTLSHFGEAVGRLDSAVRSDGPTVAPGAMLGGDPGVTCTFVRGLDNYAAGRGRELTDYLDLSGAASLLDVGCGPGSYAFALGAANPGLELHLLDLPGVVECAREQASAHDLANEVHYLGLDVLVDEIPGTYDVILVSNVLHMLGETASRRLLTQLHAKVNPGGSIVVQAQFLDDSLRPARWPALLDLIQLCVTEHGRNHTRSETERWLAEAGFERIEYAPMSLLNTNSYLRGYRP